MGNDVETITITKKEYVSLQRDSAFLASLEAMGVDNWDGYSEAYRLMDGEDEESEADIYGDDE